jgi:hypothetical protein
MGCISEGLEEVFQPPRVEVVYLSAVLPFIRTALYTRALSLIREMHPCAAILSCRDLWSTAQGWRWTYRDVLHTVSHVYLIPYPDGVVGMGVYGETCFFRSLVPNPLRKAILKRPIGIADICGEEVLADATPQRFARLIIRESDKEHLTKH